MIFADSLAETLGTMLRGVVHSADVQDRDGARGLIEGFCDAHPTFGKLFADGGYAGQELDAEVAHIDWLTIEIIKCSDLNAGPPSLSTCCERFVASEGR